MKLYEVLPARIRALAELAFKAFELDPNNPVLHNHPLQDIHKGRHRKNSRAVWITQAYRAIYVVDGADNVWYWIGSHGDYDTFTGKKSK